MSDVISISLSEVEIGTGVVVSDVESFCPKSNFSSKSFFLIS